MSPWFIWQSWYTFKKSHSFFDKLVISNWVFSMIRHFLEMERSCSVLFLCSDPSLDISFCIWMVYPVFQSGDGSPLFQSASSSHIRNHTHTSKRSGNMVIVNNSLWIAKLERPYRSRGIKLIVGMEWLQYYKCLIFYPFNVWIGNNWALSFNLKLTFFSFLPSETISWFYHNK